MHNRPYASRTSASRGSSHTSSKTRKQRKAFNQRPSEHRCNNDNCKARCNHQSDLFRHEESVHTGKQQCPFDQCEYKTGSREKMKGHMRNLQGVPSPNAQAYQTSSDSQLYQTYIEQGEDISYSAEHLDVDGLSNLDEIDGYDESSQGYDTSCTSFTSQVDFTDSDDSIAPYQNPATFLSGIGQWVDDHSSSGPTWTAWQNPYVLLQHASRFNAASIKMKPHVEEAMDCFRASFYGVRGAAAEDHIFEHR